MATRILFLCTALLASMVATAAAQPTPESNAERIRNLEEQVASLEKQLSNVTENVSKVTDNVTETLTTVNQNKERIEELTDSINTQLARQQQILEAISKTDGNGSHVLRLRGMMEDNEEFKQEMHDAVHQSLDREGVVTIANKMTHYQRFVVNKVEYGLMPGKQLTLKVPVGTITTRLPGQRIQNWSLAAPDYSQVIDIVPDERVTVRRVPTYVDPIPSQYVSPFPTVYISPPAPAYISQPTVWYWP